MGDKALYNSTIFCGFNKNDTFMGFQMRGLVFSFIIHTDNPYYVGTAILGSHPPRKRYPMKVKPSTVIKLQ